MLCLVIHSVTRSLSHCHRAKEQDKTMKNKYPRRLSVRFCFVSGLLLGLAFTKMAAAVGFSALNVSPCATSGGFDSGGFCSDIGIDYSQLTGNLVSSVHFDTAGSPNSLDNVNRITGARVPLAFFPTAGEVKVATVRQVQGGCTQQWPVGTVFAGNGKQIVKIDPDGTITNPWRDLSLFGESGVITGLFHDRWCVSGGDLIVVTGSDDGKTGGNVWRVSESADPVFLNGILKPGIPLDCGVPVSAPFRFPMEGRILTAGIDSHRLLIDEMRFGLESASAGSLSDAGPPVEGIWWNEFQRRHHKAPVLLASLLQQSTPCVSATLKGVITVPNDPKYGPWAGMIVTGDDDQIISNTGYINGNNPKIYSVNPDPASGQCDQNTSGLDSLNSQSCDATITVKDASGGAGKLLPHPEDFDFIEGDFYGVSYLNSSASGLPGQILTAPSTDFPAQTGFPDILITQEYPVDQPNILSGSPVSIGTSSGLYTVQWNASAGAFVTAQLPRSGGPDYTQWEHVTFAPPPPGLKVEKHPKQGELGSTFSPGAQVSFTIVVSNPGTGTATNVQLTDLLPGNGGLIWQSVTTTQGTCVNPIAGNTLSCSLGNIAPSGSVTVTVTSTATTPLAACQNQPNAAAIATEASGLTAQDSGLLTCTPASTQLKVEKHPKQGEAGSVFTQGSQVSFTIVVSNPASSGNQTATGVQLTDILPGNGGLVWQGATTTQGSCTNPIVGNALNCSLGNIAAGGAVTVTVTSTSTTPPAACQDQPNPAAVATSGNLTAQDSGFLTCTPASPARLAVVKTPKNGAFAQGSQVSFTIVVSNPAVAGSQPATNVQLTDILPGNGGLVWETANTTQGTCGNPIAGNILSCNLGTIAAGGSATVTVLSTATTPPAACTSQPNPVALATADGGLRAQDSGSLNCTPPPPQLAVVKTPKNGTFAQGSQVSFTMVVSNPAPAGAQAATNVQLTDTLPSNGGLSWATATATQGSCTLSGTNNSNLSCSLGTIAPQGSLTLTVTSINPTPLGACQLQPNPAALATADGGLKAQDSGSLNCTPPPPQLAVVKSPHNGTFTQGSQVSFTIVVSNPAPVGAQAATNVQLSDVLPGNGGLVWQTATPTQGSCVNPVANNSLSCSLGTISAGGSVTVTVLSTATTPAAACTSQPNPVALATADGGLSAQDSGSLNCTPPPPQLAVVKTPKNGTFAQGSQASFAIVVSNSAPAGAQSATNVQLTDTLPSNGGLSWATATATQGSCTLSGTNNSNLSCSLGTIAPQGSMTVTVTSINPTPLGACQLQPNPAALATADGGLKAQDSGSLNCTPPPPQLAVVKSPHNGTFTQGSQVSFTIAVSNPAPAGAQAATNVQLTDVLPANGALVWQNATTTQGSCVNPIVGNALSCSLGTIQPQSLVTVTIVSTPTTPLGACQSQPNPAAIATADGGLKAQDSGSLNCTPPPPQLAVAKTPKNGTFTQGSQVNFTIVVSNPAPAGAQSATNVQLTDTLPINGGLTWSTAIANQGSCTLSGTNNSNLSCSLGTIAPQGSVTVSVTSTTTTPLAACQSQSNPVALATADGGLKAQDSGSLTCTPPPPQLAVVKTPKNGTFAQGSQVSFTIVVSNPAPAGAQAASNVQLTDVLPGAGGLVWQNATTTQGSCVNPIAGNALNCSVGNIAPGGSVTVTVTSPATTPATACQNQPNPAAVATSGSLTAQDSGFLTCTPPPPQLAVTKSSGTFQFQGQATFIITVSNPAPVGGQTATNVQLSDLLPSVGGLAFVNATPSQGTCVNPIVANQLSCNLGNISAQGSVTVTVLSAGTTPAAACTTQPNPAANAIANGGLTATASGTLTCTPPSKTISIGPSSMEGAIKISAGDFVNGGYSFKTNFTGTITIAANVSITGKCIGGTLASDTLVVPLTTMTFNAVAGADWLPTGDANSVLSWQGSIKAPATLCGGGQLDASKGAVFNASITGTPMGGLVTFRFKYRDPAAKGKPNTNCLDTTDPNRNKADVCGASWSQTVTDP
jgi:uncharacterized repeat protein (TIGR01451 family)